MEPDDDLEYWEAEMQGHAAECWVLRERCRDGEVWATEAALTELDAQCAAFDVYGL